MYAAGRNEVCAAGLAQQLVTADRQIHLGDVVV